MSPRRSALRHFLAARSLRARRRFRDAGEDGFTLIELVIVLVILPLVIGGISIALIAILQDQTGISQRLSDSVDSQITSTYFVRDVQSAQYVTTTATPGATPWTSALGPATCGTGRSFVVGLAWSTGSGLSTEAVVSYWATERVPPSAGTVKVSGTTLTATSAIFNRSQIGQGIVQTAGVSAIPPGTTIKSITSPTQATLSNTLTPAPTTPITFVIGPQLVRDFCNGSSTPSTSTTSRDFFSPFTEGVVSCVKGHTSPTCATTGTNPKTASHVWAPTYAVSSVTLAVAEPAGKYDYNISATPRISNAKGSTLGTCGDAPTCFSHLPTLLLLGGFNVINETSTHTKVTVIGTAVLNTGYLKLTSGSTFTVEATTPTNPQTPPTPTPNRGKIQSTLTPVTLVCTYHTHNSSAMCSTPPGTSVSPWPPTHITRPVADPLAGLADPGPESVPPVCHAGTQISVTSQVTLSPGQYKKCPLHIKSGGVVTLNPGLYEFDTGITLTGGGALHGTSGSLIYLPCNARVNGNQVDTWATTCTEQVKVKKSTITSKRIVAGTYASLWYWQNKGDTKPFTLSGTTNHMSARGVMYLPGAPLTLTGLGTSQTPLGAIVTANLNVSNSNIRVIG